MKIKKKIIGIVLLVIILLMAVAYSNFATQLTLNGETEIIGEWNVKIIGIETQNVSQGCQVGSPTFTNSSVTFNAKLQKPGDEITYIITIKNYGTIDAVLDTATFTSDEENGSPAIKYVTTDPGNELNSGDETTFKVTVMYDKNFTEVPSIKTKTITGVIDYIQK